MKITEKAAQEIHKILENQEKSAENTYLRVGVTGVSCSGATYSFNLNSIDEFNCDEDDLVLQEGLTIVSKKTYADFLESIIIDYVETEDKKGFTFRDPLSVLNTGCGSGGCGSGGCSN